MDELQAAQLTGNGSGVELGTRRLSKGKLERLVGGGLCGALLGRNVDLIHGPLEGSVFWEVGGKWIINKMRRERQWGWGDGRWG